MVVVRHFVSVGIRGAPMLTRGLIPIREKGFRLLTTTNVGQYRLAATMLAEDDGDNPLLTVTTMPWITTEFSCRISRYWGFSKCDGIMQRSASEESIRGPALI